MNGKFPSKKKNEWEINYLFLNEQKSNNLITRVSHEHDVVSNPSRTTCVTTCRLFLRLGRLIFHGESDGHTRRYANQNRRKTTLIPSRGGRIVRKQCTTPAVGGF